MCIRDRASALPLLLDVRRMDENNRAYAYRMLRKNIMTLQLQPGCQLSEAEPVSYTHLDVYKRQAER